MSASPSDRRRRIIALILGLIFITALIVMMAQPRPAPDADEASLRAPLTQAL